MLYELTIIAPENISEMGMDNLTSLIKKHAIEIDEFEDDGIKRLAYPIQGKDRGRYLFWRLWLPQGEQTRLSSMLNISDYVLRYLLVKADIRGK